MNVVSEKSAMTILKSHDISEALQVNHYSSSSTKYNESLLMLSMNFIVGYAFKHL